MNEIIANSKKRVAQSKREKRLNDRLAREEKRKEDAHRHYIIGELVSKYFPEVLSFKPGTKAKNKIEFAPLEAFLSALAAEEELMARLKEEAQDGFSS